MAELKIGDKAPDFNLKDQDGADVNLKGLAGKWVVLYFYPRDNTPGCTIEAIDFTAALADFEKLGAVILGVSRDSTESHRRFIDKKELKVTLLSDPDHKTMNAYGVWQMKKMYGRESMGIVRTTFLVDPDGRVAHIWPGVKVKGHVDDVKGKLAELHSL